jgi:hypothetical protein
VNAAFFLLLAACSRPSGENTVSGELGGLAFVPATVVFDELSAGPGDSGPPDEHRALLALADAAAVCPLLGPLQHLDWQRCESACAGLFEEQALWPSGVLRLVWIGLTEGEALLGDYPLAPSDRAGCFTARYRPVDLTRLTDEDACFASCSEDHEFLLSDEGEASLGTIELTAWSAEELAGTLDVLLPQGELEGAFSAEPCEMGAHEP